MVRRVAIVVAGLAAWSVTALNAHPLHSSFAAIKRESSGVVAISVRLFADDFGQLLDSLSPNSTGASRELAAKGYVQRFLTLSLTDGATVPTEWCGMRLDQGLVWVCLRSARQITSAFRVRNALMFDRFTDQISIIRWSRGKETRTLVLSARVPEARLE